jgi:HJR/Mrr/RecB family endonuclease
MSSRIDFLETQEQEIPSVLKRIMGMLKPTSKSNYRSNMLHWAVGDYNNASPKTTRSKYVAPQPGLTNRPLDGRSDGDIFSLLDYYNLNNPSLVPQYSPGSDLPRLSERGFPDPRFPPRRAVKAQFWTKERMMKGLLAFAPERKEEIKAFIEVEEEKKLDVIQYKAEAKELEATPGGRIILLDEVLRAKSIIQDVYRDNSLIYRIKPREFEEMIAELMRKKGFGVELTQQTRDGGYDLIAVSSLGGLPVTFLAEYKRFAPNLPVDVDIVRSFSYVVSQENAGNGIIFTTSYFTADAEKERLRGLQKRLHFMENADIMNWVNSYLR